MAKAERMIEQVPVTTYEKRVVGVTLFLTSAEAEVLAGILRRIGGGGRVGNNKKRLLDISNSLEELGYCLDIPEEEIQPENRAICFK